MIINVNSKQDNGMPPEVVSLIQEMYEIAISICKDLNLNVYFLNRTWGSLGEGRSLTLYRQDFERFLEEADHLLDGDRYFLQHRGSDEFWPGPQARLRLHGTLMEDPKFGDLAVHQGIYINIYALDRLAKSDFSQRNLLNAYRKIQGELLAMDLSDEKNWKRLLNKRKKVMESHVSGKQPWFIVYPMLPEDISNCIISPEELNSDGELSLSIIADYTEWLFDIADDI